MKHPDGIEVFLTDEEGNRHTERESTLFPLWSLTTRAEVRTVKIRAKPGTRLRVCVRLLDGFDNLGADGINVSVNAWPQGSKDAYYVGTYQLVPAGDPSGGREQWLDKYNHHSQEYFEVPPTQNTSPVTNYRIEERSILVTFVRAKLGDEGQPWTPIACSDGHTFYYMFYFWNTYPVDLCSTCKQIKDGVKDRRRNLQKTTEQEERAITEKPGVTDPNQYAPQGETARLKDTPVSDDKQQVALDSKTNNTNVTPDKQKASQHNAGKRKVNNSDHDSARKKQRRKEQKQAEADATNLTLNNKQKNTQADATNATHCRDNLDDDRDDEEIALPTLKIEPAIKQEVTSDGEVTRRLDDFERRLRDVESATFRSLMKDRG